MSALRQILAIALLPGIVVLVVPGTIISSRQVNVGWRLPWPANLAPQVAGLLFVGLGLALLVQTISLFVREGRGTLAPWDPTQRLVVHGIYRYVRNPMITGVLSILLGETIFFGSRPLMYWFLFALLINLTYIPLVEEPGLELRFGESYSLYKHNVPRWIPRLTPWQAPWDESPGSS